MKKLQMDDSLAKVVEENQEELADEFQAAEDRLRELEDAHVAQSELVAKLRTDNSTVQKWRKTAHEQEGVIVKLEALMEQALGTATPPAAACISTLSPCSKRQ